MNRAQMSGTRKNESERPAGRMPPARGHMVTLYLDIDGVLSPLPDLEYSTASRFRPIPWPDRRGLTFGLRPTERETEVAVPWSPTMVAALEELRVEFNLRLVWATSWLSHFPHDGIRILTNEFNALQGGVEPEWPSPQDADDQRRQGGGDENRPRATALKLRVVLSDQESVGGGPFIWLDDDGQFDDSDPRTLPGGMFAQIKRCTPDMDSLLIAPNRFYGIAPGHLARMRKWLSCLTQRS